MLAKVPNPFAGELIYPKNPLRFSAMENRPITPTPLLGEHTTEILREILGMSGPEIDQHQKEGTIEKIARSEVYEVGGWNSISIHKEEPVSILFTPERIGSLQIANRLVMPAMTTSFADPEGHVTDRMKAYYRARGEGGAGLIIVELAAVEPRGRRLNRNLTIYRDDCLPGLAGLASAVKETGSRVFLQLNHGGRECSRAVTGEQPVAPSAIASPYSGIKSQGELPRTLSLKEIEALEEAFTLAACRAKQAGFDGVEIHGAHGYLISQFCSPLTNLRTDAYGFDLRGRTFFFRNVIRRCKERAGADFPVIARINGRDYVEGVLDLPESLEMAGLLQEAGADGVHVSVGMHASRPYMMIPGMDIPRGCNLELAGAFKKALKVPVIGVGRINDPATAEAALSGASADFVALGRALIADPEWPNKVKNGRKDLRLCIACDEGCIGRLHQGLPMSCSINPAVGKEAEFKSRLATPPRHRRVWVIGAGPAGMEAARIAAARGCEVTLWEKNNHLGGQLNLAVIPPGRQEIGNILTYYQAVLPEAGVAIRSGETFRVSSLKDPLPEAVVVATGASPTAPSIIGVDQGHVVQAWDILSGAALPGKKCVVIGAGPVGMETSEYLALRGHTVLLFDILPWPEVMKAYPRAEVVLHEMKIEALAIAFHGPVEIEAIDDSALTFREKGWRKSILDIDTVVLAAGVRPCPSPLSEMKAMDLPCFIVGDCSGIGKIIDAVHSGAEAALAL